MGKHITMHMLIISLVGEIRMNVILIIQIVAMVLELIAKGLSESDAISKASRIFNVSESFIRNFFINK